MWSVSGSSNTNVSATGTITRVGSKCGLALSSAIFHRQSPHWPSLNATCNTNFTLNATYDTNSSVIITLRWWKIIIWAYEYMYVHVCLYVHICTCPKTFMFNWFLWAHHCVHWFNEVPSGCIILTRLTTLPRFTCLQTPFVTLTEEERVCVKGFEYGQTPTL